MDNVDKHFIAVVALSVVFFMSFNGARSWNKKQSDKFWQEELRKIEEAREDKTHDTVEEKGEGITETLTEGGDETLELPFLIRLPESDMNMVAVVTGVSGGSPSQLIKTKMRSYLKTPEGVDAVLDAVQIKYFKGRDIRADLHKYPIKIGSCSTLSGGCFCQIFIPKGEL